MENDLRRWMRLVETGNEPVLPEIKLKSAAPNLKLIFINGEKVGSLHRASTDEFRGYNTWRKSGPVWSGKLSFDGTELAIGSTEKVAELLPKVTKIVRSYLIRKQHTDGQGQPPMLP
jgi:hypothetical protein